MIRILVTGCHGLLGQALVEGLGPDVERMDGIDLHEDSFFTGLRGYEYHHQDLTERTETIELIHRIQPSVIIQTAAMTSLNTCEVARERCWQVNVRAVENVVEAARRTNARMILLSTDHVFNGEAGPYSELDRPDPLSYYGKSKLAAENAVLGGGVELAIIRTVSVFGRGRHLKPNFVSWLVGKLREGKEVRVVSDQMSNVTFVGDLVRAIRKVILLNKSDLYHVAGRQIINRFEFARHIAQAYGLSPDPIQPTLTRLLDQPAPRPLQGGLVVDKAEKELKLRFLDVEEALRQYREQEATFN
jgi:dTDP-4-dehydrorhamnose reductase